MQRSQEVPSTNVLDKTIGQIVAEDYRTAKIFEKYRIDFCCGGKLSLAVSCEEKEIDPVRVIAEIEAVKSEPAERSQDYGSWELPFLIDYIVQVHHTYIKENSGKIAAYAHKIVEVHGAEHPELIKIAGLFDRVVSDMADHLREEEQVFFPAIKRIYASRKAGSAPDADDLAMIKSLLKKVVHEHETIGDAVHAIRHLAKDYAIPENVCNTFVITYRMLKEFEDNLHTHVHLENNILFPKTEQNCQ